MKNASMRLGLILVAAIATFAGNPAEAQVPLDKVIITGSRIDSNLQYLEQEAMFMEIAAMWDLNAFSHLTPIEIVAIVVAFTPCGSNPKITQQTRQTTSQDADPVRQVAGTNIIDAALGARQPGLAGKTVRVMYSDGGMENFTYDWRGSTHHIKGNLTHGDGVAGSACKAPT
ncbi:MAG: hypothetical protein ACREYF_13120 [Gammaproteobacteria bacterium]